MNILSWNIQATKGVDGRFDVMRIAELIKAYGDLDIICLQEISRHIPDQNNDDQLALIGGLFSNHKAVWAPGFTVLDGDQRESQFGNVSLVKPSLLKKAQVHSLPSPVVDTLQMPRTMVELLIESNDHRFTLFNTHLAFHSETEIASQLRALTSLRDERIAKSRQKTPSGLHGPYAYSAPSEEVILCGDLNVDANSELYDKEVARQGWIDCWEMQSTSANKANGRPPTCGCFDAEQWPQGPHVRDYFLATSGIASKTKKVEVNVETDASDHQPVFIELTL